MKRYSCAIESVIPLNASTNQVLLVLPDDVMVEFKAGQYLEILLPSGKRCPFSIANPPSFRGKIELHIKPSPDSEDSNQIQELIQIGNSLDVKLPLGKCHMGSAPDGPLVLMAASTGITQMKSILEHLLESKLIHPVFLYWGVLIAEDLYLDAFFSSLTNKYPLFHYIPVVSDPDRSAKWNGRTGLLSEVVIEDFEDMNDLTIYVSGSPAMVYATLDAFLANGMPRKNMHSDMFYLSPRS